MNGLISESAPRTLQPPKAGTTLTVGICLFAGFLAGLNISTSSLLRLNPFQTEILDFHKISWISEPSAMDFRLENSQSIAAANELIFTPYVMKTGKEKRFFFQSFRKSKVSNFTQLQKIARQFKKPKTNIFQDFRNASLHLRQEFTHVVVGQEPNAGEVLSTTASSADTSYRSTSIPNRNIESGLTAALDTETLPPMMSNVSLSRLLKKERVQPAELSSRKAAEQAGKLLPEFIPQSSFASNPVSDGLPTMTINQNAPDTPAVAALFIAANSTAPQLARIPAQSIEIAQVRPTDFGGGATRATGRENLDQGTAEDLPVVTTAPISKDLSEEDQKVLTEGLLNYQLQDHTQKPEAVLASRSRPIQNTQAIAVPHSDSVAQPNGATGDSNPDTENQETGSPQAHQAYQGKNGSPATSCETLSNHLFIRPMNGSNTALDSQACPTSKTWVSKNADGAGWVKVESADHIATITLHPAANRGSTLLIDQNALALLALKTGVHVTKGMGVIIGVAPDGYKVGFTGRAEETEYFESNGRNYFAILNAEPGAGVVELESKSSQNLNSTIFTPVLEDSVTYLDLSAPVVKDLPIKVVKSGAANDPEVVNLTVGISTQNGIQAITQAEGKAILKNVNLVPGYPVFVDVSSRNGQNISYTYRYQLKHLKKSGFYVVNEIAEKSVSHWLQQVKQGLSDQSAMVVGFYDRKRLDGFKNHYFSKVEPLTSKFGLEPLNYTILWNGDLSLSEPLEGDAPRFMSVQVAEGLSQVHLYKDEAKVPAQTELLPISPRVIHVISE